MNDEHRAHLDRVIDRVSQEVGRKYAKGQSDHGGELWRKAGMLSHVEAETWDFVVYVCTMREQLEALLTEIRMETQAQRDSYAVATLAELDRKLARILGKAEE